MTQKLNKFKGDVGKLFSEAPKIHKKGRSIANRKRVNRNGGGGEKFDLSICYPYNLNQISKGKCVSNNTSQHQMQMDIDQEAMEFYFEEEIFMDIFSRLPVQSLLRFKCVSNFWNALISDPGFKMKHLNYAKNDETSQKLLVAQYCNGKNDNLFAFYSSSLSSVQVIDDEEKLDSPSNCKPVSCILHCCCDGLVLLTVTDRLDRQLLLWNPSTRESILLPLPECTNSQSTLPDGVYGLEYDVTSDDYKILVVNLNAVSAAVGICIEILALKSGSWRKIGNHRKDICRLDGFTDCGMDSLAFVNGAFHWLGLSQIQIIMFSFNMSNEVIVEIPLLKQMLDICSGSPSYDHGVSALRGTLCFYTTYRGPMVTTFKLWVMKDYGVEESWTQLLTIKGANIFHTAKPKYLFVDDEVLLRCKYMSSGSQFLTSRGPFDAYHRAHVLEQGLVYTESLISPRSLI